jgi:hypothetical protein
MRLFMLRIALKDWYAARYHKKREGRRRDVL